MQKTKMNKRKAIFMLLAILLIGLSFNSCSNFSFFGPSIAAPLNTAASDEDFADRIEVSWENVEEALFYQIYRTTNPDQIPVQIGDSASCKFSDHSTVTGTTYYYSVKAVSFENQESEFSKNDSGRSGGPLNDNFYEKEENTQGRNEKWFKKTTALNAIYQVTVTSVDIHSVSIDVFKKDYRTPYTLINFSSSNESVTFLVEPNEDKINIRAASETTDLSLLTVSVQHLVN